MYCTPSRARSASVRGSAWTSHPRAGVDLAGMSDMGGVKHFNVAVDTPEGDVELLKKVMQGANKEVDEGAEERKGGADKIGKCFYSAGLEWVSVYQHIDREHVLVIPLQARSVPSGRQCCRTVQLPVSLQALSSSTEA